MIRVLNLMKTRRFTLIMKETVMLLILVIRSITFLLVTNFIIVRSH